ncbi:AAA family ATPase [Plasmodium coatneyi]|uniref:AAA family ATPase n=1 Tax=Plasmodium coatneyi TaxID=208452 RepID=A0A1B1DTX2_9APIC|nr:AAA family ATPase [Plasmodium coatneyi]ANQ06202.1 AAA family ATPase [Plasmodium coatneyi]
MKNFGGAIWEELLYNEMREEERKCLQDMMINDIWCDAESSEDDLRNKGEVNPNDFIFTNTHSNIFENYSDHETYNEVIDLLRRTDVVDNVGSKLEGNPNFASGVQAVDIKNFMNFDPLFVKVYHERGTPQGGDSTREATVEEENETNEANEADQTYPVEGVEQRKVSKEKNVRVSADFSDDDIYTPKALKRKREEGEKAKRKNENESGNESGNQSANQSDNQNGFRKLTRGDAVEKRSNASVRKIKQKKKNQISDAKRGISSLPSVRKTTWKGKKSSITTTDKEKKIEDLYSPIKTKRKEAFSNAFDILIKRKNEKNEEAIKAYNDISSKRRRSRNLSGSSQSESNEESHMNDYRIGCRLDRTNDKKDEKRKSHKKNGDDLKDGCEDIPEVYQHLIDQGLEINVLRYALSMKMSSNEHVKESDIIGLYDIKKIIKDKIVNAILRPDLFTGLNRAAKGILLFGPPGTGKTMIAKWVASHCRCSFYNVSTSSLFSKYIGETEKIITCLFKCAEVDNPSILFFDEIDSILGMRKKDEDDTTIRIKNQLLQMIDGINTKKDAVIVIIGATNRPDMIDDAALRRFNKRVYIPLPDLQARKEQIRYIITKHTHSGFQMSESELDSISHKLHNWNGSDIYHLCTKCYEYVYDDAVEQYNGIENIPNTSIFRAIRYDDFIKAMSQVNTSYKCVFDYDEWSQKHGAL